MNQVAERLGYSKDDVKGMELVKKLERMKETVEGLERLAASLDGLDAALAGITHAMLQQTFAPRAQALKVLAAVATPTEATSTWVKALPPEVVKNALHGVVSTAAESRKKKQLAAARHLLTQAESLGLGRFDELAAYVA